MRIVEARRCGASFSSCGPATSVSISCRPPTASRGRKITASTISPMPPIHWVCARHSISGRDCACSSVMTVAPVAVNPAVLSKNASIGAPAPPAALPST